MKKRVQKVSNIHLSYPVCSVLAGVLILLLASCNPDADGINQDNPLATVRQEWNELGRGLLPVFVVNTRGATIPNEPKIPADYSVVEQDAVTFAGRIGIELRGSSSRRLFEKKSYGVETWGNSNEDVDVPLLGFAEEEDWILYGPYADKTLLRNILAYELSNRIGLYAAKTRFVDLVINDEYMGVYVFMEKLKRDNARIDIEKMTPSDTDAATITGGYILKIDKADADDNSNEDWSQDAVYTESKGFRSDYSPEGQLLNYPPYGNKTSEETYFLYEYPDYDEINDAQRNYIQTYINDFEMALLTDDFAAGVRRYTDFIDVESFARYFIINELAANPDAYRLSTFLHKPRGGKLYAGPVWDFNIGWGMDGRSAVDQWIYQYNQHYPQDLWLVHFWWTRLMEDPEFRLVIQRQWEVHRNNVLSIENIHAMLDEQIRFLEMEAGIERNFQRWEVIGEVLPFNSFVGQSYDEEVTYLKNWITVRHNWLDQQIMNW